MSTQALGTTGRSQTSVVKKEGGREAACESGMMEEQQAN